VLAARCRRGGQLGRGPVRRGRFRTIVEQIEYSTLWLNLLRMTIIPLVFAAGHRIASVANAASTGRLAARSIFVFAVLLVTATTYACIVLPIAYSLWPVDPGAAAGFIAGAGSAPVTPVSPPSVGEWLSKLAPANPIAAAAETAVLPLVVFAIFFGFAATCPGCAAHPMVASARWRTMIVIVRWALFAAPGEVRAVPRRRPAPGADTEACPVRGYRLHRHSRHRGMAFLFAMIWGR
jgi:Na+/H+-dicarboxylate symporter